MILVDLKDPILKFTENRGHLRKATPPQNIAREVRFSEPRFLQCTGLHTVKIDDGFGPYELCNATLGSFRTLQFDSQGVMADSFG